LVIQQSFGDLNVGYLKGTTGYLLYRVGLDDAQLVDGRRGNPPDRMGNNTAGSNMAGYQYTAMR
jgi:hypothetical protein